MFSVIKINFSLQRVKSRIACETASEKLTVIVFVMNVF